MLIQGTGAPLTVEFPIDIAESDSLEIMLLSGGGELRRWETAEMIIDGDTAAVPLTAAEWSSFPSEDISLELACYRGGTEYYRAEQAVIIQKRTAGATDYNELTNKPSIESVILTGNKTFEDLGLENISNIELEEILI